MRRNLLVIVLTLTAVLLVLGNLGILNYLDRQRTQELKAVHKNTIDEFSEELRGFGLFVTAIQTYINEQETFPTQEQLFHYVRALSTGTAYENKYVISILDTTHIFMYSFNSDELNSNDLVGRNLENIIGSESLKKYLPIMENDSLHLFKPHNLVEGKVGISLNFRVKNKGKTIGYATPIIDFKAAMQEVYDQNNSDKFIFRFSTGDGIDFDREIVHDGSKVYHSKNDVLFYQNFPYSEEAFEYGSISIYGYNFRLGAAHKSPESNIWIPICSVVWFITFAALLLYINNQSIKLEHSNSTVGRQKEELAVSNLELEKANASKNRFISILGHDIKSPLNSIKGFIDIYESNLVSKEEASSIMKDLGKVVANTLDLLENLLSWARVNDKKIDANLQEIDLTGIIHEINELFAGSSQMKDITLVFEQNHPMKVLGDKDMLSTIFRNIINNAIKFTPNGGMVTIQADENQNDFLIKVIDTGIGMDEQKKKELFQLDKEIHSFGTAGERGTGLGLVLVREYLNIHNGEITVESKVNEGTTFHLRIPKNPNPQ